MRFWLQQHPCGLAARRVAAARRASHRRERAGATPRRVRRACAGGGLQERGRGAPAQRVVLPECEVCKCTGAAERAAAARACVLARVR
jgi:hypothetical protein